MARMKYISANIQKKKSSLEQNLFLDNQMHMVSIKIPQKGRKKNFKFFSRITKKIRASRCLVQLSIWRSGESILNINTQLNPLEI